MHMLCPHLSVCFNVGIQELVNTFNNNLKKKNPPGTLPKCKQVIYSVLTESSEDGMEKMPLGLS